MFLIKEILVLTTCLILAAIGITGISNTDSNGSSNIQLQSQTKTNSSDDILYYHVIS